MIGIVWGLLGGVLIGVSDCIARVTTARVTIGVLLFAVMAGSVLVLTPVLAFWSIWPAWHAWGWGAAAVSGVLNLVGLAFIFKALMRGPIAVASPTASSFTVMLVGLNILAGEPYDWRQLAAALFVFLGIVMLARPERRGAEALADYDAAGLRTTALLALGAAGSVAIRMFLAQEARVALGTLEALYLTRVFAAVGAAAFIGWQASRGQRLAWPRGGATLGLVFVQMVLETLALGAFLAGSAGTGRVGAAIGFSAFPAATAATAWLWLGERISRRRVFWMAVVALGVALAVLFAPR
ncbi:MAG TPA: EamA family transporter [Thermohalobaculum sp.]|nr:EamA family transporter [Thermohalobaculum sp.]